MKLVIGSDKAGYSLKEALKHMLEEQGHQVHDVGTTNIENPKPHTITGIDAAKIIRDGQAEKGILICGTGMGMAIAANKNKGVYAAVVESIYAAEYCRKINDANIICMGAFIVGESMAKEMVNIFLKTEFVENFPEWRREFLNEQKKNLAAYENTVFK